MAPPWMSVLKDDLSITQLSIPGTHDSHAIKFHINDSQPNFDLLKWALLVSPISPAGLNLMGQIQERTVTQHDPIGVQLRFGVRYVDLRVGNPDWNMWHGKVKLKGTIRDCLKDIHDFLKENPRETVLVSIKWDQEGADSSEPGDMQDTIKNMWEEVDNRRWYSGTNWPRLGEVRGRAILLRRYGGDSINYGIDFRKFYGDKRRDVAGSIWAQQDDGKGGHDPSGTAKVATDSLTNVWNCSVNDNTLYFTGFAGQSMQLDASHLLDPKFQSPRQYADVCNPKLLQWLRDPVNPPGRNHRLGVVIMDFATPELTAPIYDFNRALAYERAVEWVDSVTVTQ